MKFNWPFRAWGKTNDPFEDPMVEYEKQRQVRLKNCKPRIVKCTSRKSSDYGLWYCFSRSGGHDMGLFIGTTPKAAYDQYKRHIDQYKTYC